MLVCGVDDAGRGSVIGPLVIAGVLVNDKEIDKLKLSASRIPSSFHQPEEASWRPKSSRSP